MAIYVYTPEQNLKTRENITKTGQTPNPAMLQTLLIWAVFSASLLPPSSQRCFKANESQCRDVDFTFLWWTGDRLRSAK
ncbi:hypothetical protein QTP70_010402 [Hemibagrus guttatus]|uniref:Uncharacterized protein n=1 Tax=Hemibagrus guttatus TaxID=175788 RepID=A0AAE0UVY7_9TELE|nr:hypothetical protein QTP70_010402 [Hemibagrus guttatus]KAK3552342.1 hypothetical protein QTP86_010723 [Hemibagrus guttatus]